MEYEVVTERVWETLIQLQWCSKEILRRVAIPFKFVQAFKGGIFQKYNFPIHKSKH